MLSTAQVNKLANLSTIGNSQLRQLYKTVVNPDYHDIIYVLNINTPENGFKTKIGRTTLEGFNRRLKQHIHIWGSENITVGSVKSIQHWKVENQFHKHMKSYKQGKYVSVIKSNGKTFEEFYEDSPDVIEELHKFTL
jgi:hypothetical protein